LLNDHLNAAHARWRDGILAHHIVDVRHVPGKLNIIADGLSRQWEGQPRDAGLQDGSKWTVSEDWEANSGLVNDILCTTEITNENTFSRLLQRFVNEPVFQQVIESLAQIDSTKPLRDQKRAQHQAQQYLIEDEKLWRLWGGTSARARSRLECITKEEATNLAREQHERGGHWGRDAIKIALTDKVYSPGLDASIMDAISECAKCKNFGNQHLHSLLEPITRRHPFELLVGDYLTLPKAQGYHTLGVYLDTFSQHVWVFKYKSAGTARTTTNSLGQIFSNFIAPETFMSDGGRHFHNTEVKEFCERWSCKTHIVAAYSPWINGLVEGTNKILLHVLKRLCAPNLGEDDYAEISWETLPNNWPKHLDEAVTALNYRILPALKFSPKELLIGR
jgi:transposase InsO family protein